MSDRTDDPKPDRTVKVERGITGIEVPFHSRQYVKVYDYAGNQIFHGLAGSCRIEILAPKGKA